MIHAKKIFVILIAIFFSNISLGQNCNTNIPATTPTNQFKDNNDGTVTDNKTNLMWVKCVIGFSHSCVENNMYPYPYYPLKMTLGYPLNLDGYLEIFNSNFHFGYKDWRFPTMQELMSIVELQCANPAINLSVFPNTPPTGVYWTSSVSPFIHNYTLFEEWYVDFKNGLYLHKNFDDGEIKGFVRLVRDQK